MPPPPAQAPKKKFATLGDIRGGAGPSHAGHGHDDDDDEEDYEPSDDDNQNLYAGGEKSGLAVENPDDLKKKILERAKKLVSPQTLGISLLKVLLLGTSQDPAVTTHAHRLLASPGQLALSAEKTPQAK